MQSRALLLEVDVGAIRANARAIKNAVGPKVELFACLKGDAYGCGIRLAAPALAAEGVRQFAVGAIDDALAIRQAGVQGEVLLYPNCLSSAASTVESNDFTVTLNSIDEAAAWDAAAGGRIKAFIKVDVGALRGGVMPREAAKLGAAVRRMSKLDIRGVYAHLHLPDPVRMRDHALHQLRAFDRAVQSIEAAGVPRGLRMVSGTAALLQYPEMDLDAVDPGRALFGLGFAGTTRDLRLQPAVRRWSSRLLLVKDVLPEDVAPYPAPFPLAEPRRIGVAPVGWGDGLPRQLPSDAHVLVRGQRAPLLPPSHFEHIRIDLTGVPDAQYGDEVVILGRQGAANVPLAEVAEWCGKDPLHFIGTLPRHIDRIAVRS